MVVHVAASMRPRPSYNLENALMFLKLSRCAMVNGTDESVRGVRATRVLHMDPSSCCRGRG